MLSLKIPLSRKSEAAADLPPRWHPDFCVSQRLPDVKIVRTSFFINVGAISVASVLVLWTGYREFQYHSLRTQVNQALTNIEHNRKAHGEVIHLSKVFSDEARRLSELQQFVSVPILPTEFVALLAQSLPAEAQIDNLELRYVGGAASQVQIHGMLAGSKDQASGIAQTYVETLRTQPRLAEVFDTVTLNSLTPDSRTGNLTFTITLKFKPEGKKS